MNFYRYENFLQPHVSEDLLTYCLKNEINFKQATIHDGAVNSVNKEYRKSFVFRDLGDFKCIIKEEIGKLLPDIYRKLMIKPFEVKSYELELAAHGDGAFFKEHIDTLTGKLDNDKARTISIVYYFFSEPKQFEGGELQINPVEFMEGDDEPVILAPINNSLIVFPSFSPHEVLPIKLRDPEFKSWRFTVNCWLYK